LYDVCMYKRRMPGPHCISLYRLVIHVLHGAFVVIVFPFSACRTPLVHLPVCSRYYSCNCTWAFHHTCFLLICM
jgi:hypothetical protein